MPFLTATWAVESTSQAGWYRLTRPVVYQGKTDVFTVPEGFLTDYATVPRVLTWLFARDDSYTEVAILHDFLCVEADAERFSRRDADGIFRRVLRESGVDPLTRWTLWAAVRAGGLMQDGATPKEWLQVIGIGAVMVPVLAVPVTLAGSVWLVFRVVGKVAGLAERLHNRLAT